jgi:hypothetical protein
MKRRLLAFAAAILASAAPPPGAAPAANPATNPAAAPAGSYEEAVAARHAGDTARAVAILRGIVAAEPDDADAQLQLGLALLAAGELDGAEAALRRTLALAPGYEDAAIALARVAQRRGDTAGALAALEPVGPGNSEAAGLRTQIRSAADGEARWQLDLDGSYSRLDAQPDWREARRVCATRRTRTRRSALRSRYRAASASPTAMASFASTAGWATAPAPTAASAGRPMPTSGRSGRSAPAVRRESPRAPTRPWRRSTRARPATGPATSRRSLRGSSSILPTVGSG